MFYTAKSIWGRYLDLKGTHVSFVRRKKHPWATPTFIPFTGKRLLIPFWDSLVLKKRKEPLEFPLEGTRVFTQLFAYRESVVWYKYKLIPCDRELMSTHVDHPRPFHWIRNKATKFIEKRFLGLGTWECLKDLTQRDFEEKYGMKIEIEMKGVFAQDNSQKVFSSDKPQKKR
jgi:hypothetical protein